MRDVVIDDEVIMTGRKHRIFDEGEVLGACEEVSSAAGCFGCR